MSGIRRRLTIIGTVSDGFLRASYRIEPDEYTINLPVDRVPSSLRVPNTTFVGLLEGLELVRVEVAGEAWLEIQNKVRDVLNRQWDPLGVGDAVDDEYDMYIEDLYRLVKSNAPKEAIADLLRSIEVARMELRPSPPEKLSSVAGTLRNLRLPDV